MGYSTNFDGALILSRVLTPIENEYINTFSEIRHVKRDVAVLILNADPFSRGEVLRKELNLPYGDEGEFFIGDGSPDGTWSPKLLGMIDYNDNPKNWPGLWCNWEVANNELYWNGAEKFYNYVEWLEYLIKNFFTPWNVILDGVIEWKGEENSDMGKIVVLNNKITVQKARIVYD